MDMEKILKHMAWANQEIIGAINTLPKESLDAYAVNPEWTVGNILRHIGSASNWYVWRLLDRANFTEAEKTFWDARLKDADEEAPLMEDISNVLGILKDSDRWLLEESRKPEGEIIRDFKGESIVITRSTILAQAVHHATEHRAQAVAALELRGYSSINLDDYDLWNFNSKATS
jgi:uncharacterized damage-inducible protein DinB